MRVFFGIPRFVPAHGTQIKQQSASDTYDTGETLEQYLNRIGSNGRKSIVRSLQENYLEKLPEANLRNPQIRAELAVTERLIFPAIESGKLPAEDELQEVLSTIDFNEAKDLASFEELLINVVQQAYRNGVHFF